MYYVLFQAGPKFKDSLWESQKNTLTWGLGSPSSDVGYASDILGKSLLFLDPSIQVDLAEYGLRSIGGLWTTQLFILEFLWAKDHKSIGFYFLTGLKAS